MCNQRGWVKAFFFGLPFNPFFKNYTSIPTSFIHLPYFIFLMLLNPKPAIGHCHYSYNLLLLWLLHGSISGWWKCCKLKLCTRGMREQCCYRGSWEHCWGELGALFACCCMGVGKHCRIQEHCCSQSEVVWQTTLKERQSETTLRTTPREDRCSHKFGKCFFSFHMQLHEFFFFPYKLVEENNNEQQLIVIFFCFFMMFVSKKDIDDKQPSLFFFSFFYKFSFLIMF